MERIGFIGIGIMGKPMATNLFKAGYPLFVHDMNRSAVRDLVDMGAEAADSPREVARKCKKIITMLPNSPEVEEVITGKNGLFQIWQFRESVR